MARTTTFGLVMLGMSLVIGAAAADVFVFADGTAWVASELQARQAERRRVHESARRTPTVLGWTLAGSAGFAAFLGLGLIFWVDRSGEVA